jgi:CDP-6-deoxy-D-xylo-4-hexulose-3-dehydrase
VIDIKHAYVENFPVYNLEIEDDHSYHAGNVAVHNCFCSPGQDNACGHRFDQQWGTLPIGYDHKYVYSEISMNLKITDMQAALGFSQLKKLPDFKMARQENYNFLAEKMKILEDIFIPMEALKESNVCWFGYPLIFKSDDNNISEFIQYLESDCKIGTRRLFAGNLLRHPAYIKLPKKEYRVSSNLENTDRIMNNVVWVGVHPSLNKDCMNYIFESIYKFFVP